MIRVDPASPEFETLPKKEQAKIYYFDIGWEIPAISDELDVRSKTITNWLDGAMQVPRSIRPGHSASRRTPEECERDYGNVCALFQQGLKPLEIMERLSLPRSTVYEVLKDRFGSARQRRAA